MSGERVKLCGEEPLLHILSQKCHKNHALAANDGPQLAMDRAEALMLSSNPKDLFIAHTGTVVIQEMGSLTFLLFFNKSARKMSCLSVSELLNSLASTVDRITKL
jgi:hypothetical protein